MNLLLYGLAVLIWGSTWLFINFQLGVVAPEVSVVWRYLLASALIFAWCLARGERLRFDRRAHAVFAGLGALLFGLNYMAAYTAQLYIDSALNAVVFTSMVWLNILFARLFFGVKIEVHLLIGAALGLVGIVVLFWPQLRQVDPDNRMLIGALISFGGAVVASLGNMLSQRAQARQLPVMAANAWGMLYGAGLVALLAALSGREFRFEWTFEYVGSLLYLAVFGSVVAFGCYLTLLGRIGAQRAGYVVVMFPVVAIGLSLLFEGLAVTDNLLVGVTLVLLGNSIIIRRRRPAVPTVVPRPPQGERSY